MIKVLVAGSRNWTDIETIADVLSKLPNDTTVVHGACQGADMISGVIAKELGFVVRDYPADWDRHKLSAGPIRNRKMLSAEHTKVFPISLCIIFHDDLEGSKGTKDLVSIVSPLGIPVRSVTSNQKVKK